MVTHEKLVEDLRKAMMQTCRNVAYMHGLPFDEPAFRRQSRSTEIAREAVVFGMNVWPDDEQPALPLDRSVMRNFLTEQPQMRS